ncbi:MAG: hypothetical protein KatS3mg108_1406 [Isosphaeraceae bacterium]|jgi:hypothetical protein|nr:MAG: hypothetical protein KatS3mg108_1406 [Isosphaeraceae bacterium]
MLAFHLARFKVDATPPLGHPLCGGWITPARAVDDPLWLRGLVIQAEGPPVVLAAFDWTGILNRSHQLWREALADAARTSPDRVAIHTVHQHNAPFIDHDANQWLAQARSEPLIFDPKWHDALIDRARARVRAALDGAVPVTHVGFGLAPVAKVASNRRVMGPDGKVAHIRFSACPDPAVRAAPEGTIDPNLRSVAFYGPDDRPLARLHYYTTHPMSYYGDGRVTADFVGIARNRRQTAEPDCRTVYFTGCAGNITAGKYNDGSPDNRAILADRLHAGMIAADTRADTNRHAFTFLRWSTHTLQLQPFEDLDAETLQARIHDPARTTAERNSAAMRLSFLRRCESRHGLVLVRCDLPGVTLLHLPGETFVEYQLEAQQLLPDAPLATAAYGDDGPWYLCLERSFAEGGYEPTASFAARSSEHPYRAAIRSLLSF